MNSITIEIGGRPRLISFGLKAIGEIIDHDDMGFVGLGHKMKNNPLVTTPLIIYYGAKNGVERNGALVDFTLGDVCDWIEDMGLSNPELIKAINVFSDSLTVFLNDLKGPAPEGGDEAKKK